MKILGLAHVQVTAPASRIDAAIAFYREIMQLEPVPKPEALAGNGGAWFALGDQQLHVSIECPEADVGGTSKRHICYEVTDLDECRRVLEEHDLEITPDRQPIPGWRRLFTKDPAGNRIELIEALP